MWPDHFWFLSCSPANTPCGTLCKPVIIGKKTLHQCLEIFCRCTCIFRYFQYALLVVSLIIQQFFLNIHHLNFSVFSSPVISPPLRICTCTLLIHSLQPLL